MISIRRHFVTLTGAAALIGMSANACSSEAPFSPREDPSGTPANTVSVSVEGTVTSELDRMPVAGALVRIVAGDGAVYSQTSDAGGRYGLMVELDRRRECGQSGYAPCWLTVDASGFIGHESDRPMPCQTRTVQIDVLLEPGPRKPGPPPPLSGRL